VYFFNFYFIVDYKLNEQKLKKVTWKVIINYLCKFVNLNIKYGGILNTEY